jgi:hypothetical protein
MKRLFLVIILAISTFYNVNAQSGKWAIKFKSGLYNQHGKDGQSSHCSFDVYYKFDSNSDYSHIYQWGEEVAIHSKEWVYLSPDANIYSLTTKITGLMLHSKLAFSGSDPDDEDDRNIEVDYQSQTNGLVGYKSTHFCENICDDGYVSQHLFRGYDGYIDLYIFPSDVQIAYKSSGDLFLTSEDKAGILAPTGYTTDTYKWVYFSQSTNQWIPFYNTNLQGKQAIDISAEDVYGPNYNDSIMKYKNTSIALEFYAYDEIKGPKSISHSNTLILANKLSAPHIDSVSYQMPTCHGSDDAKLFIQFDREPYSGETLYVSTNGDRFTTPAVFTAGSKVLEIPNLLADTFNISLYGTYHAGTDTINTYTDGVKHKYSIRIPERPALSISQISQSAVHCYGGRDGKITVSASGGNNLFDAILKQGNVQVDSVRFSSSGQGIFSGLKAGKYSVYLKDSNSCRLDSLGNEIVEQIEVAQPSQKVSIKNYDSKEPTGFGLSDGWADVVFAGGTSVNYMAVWKDSFGNVIPNTITQNGDDYISKATNIKSGTYHVSVFDANYSSADQQVADNQCGCTDTISFFVTQPSKLDVSVTQYHYVTCNGDNDGALVAHAKGGIPLAGGLPYTYQWMKVKGSTTIDISQTDSIINGLSSGTYRVKITDRNGIEATSADYLLVEPDPLTVTTKVLQNIRCSGDSIGIIEAAASGGTPPYTYIWSTNDTTAIVRGLPEGKYVVGVRDARYKENIAGHYCFAQAIDSIASPNPIKLDAIVKNPVCQGYSNGEITLSVTGGTPPYSFYWENGSTTSTRSNLPNGNYSVRVTDSSGCFAEKDFSLTEPAEVLVNLGKDIVLCKGQTIDLNGDIGLPAISYKWTDATGTVLSTSPIYSVNTSGVYKLTASTVNGCMGTDEIKVETSDDEANPDFVVASQIANNTKIYAVNISQSVVDSIVWILPSEATVWEKLEDRVQFEISENGQYSVGMALYKNKCSSTLYKTVQVVNKEDIAEDDSSEPFIKKFIVTPNPNNGTFQAVVELREPSDYQLLLYDSVGKLITSQDIKNKMAETTSFKLTNTGSGAFYLKFVSAKGTSVFHVMIN